jgi:hypothetical protein
VQNQSYYFLLQVVLKVYEISGCQSGRIFVLAVLGFYAALFFVVNQLFGTVRRSRHQAVNDPRVNVRCGALLIVLVGS